MPLHRSAVLALAMLTTAELLFAGPLDPPAGPVTSTLKPLTEVEPRIAVNAANTPGDGNSLFKITQSGSYYLTGNITGVAGSHAIKIDASNVTLDLMGFRILGALGALDGIFVNGPETNLTIRNGSVRSFGGDGLDAESCESVRLVDFTVRNCDGRGVALGDGCTLSNVIADSNLSTGIYAGSNAALALCVARGNGTIGILAGTSATIVNCTATQNGGNGISTGGTCTISTCTSFQNSGNGIFAGGGSMITGCKAGNNTLSGINTGVSPGCRVSGCSAGGNGENGIIASSGTAVVGCSANENGIDGIVVGNGSNVEGCMARENTGDGIQCAATSVIRGNTCSLNGAAGGDGAGIHVTSGDNRIESNNCTGADRGVDVDAAGNIIIRNTCAANTVNWEIVINNICGPVIDRGGAFTAAISGDSGAGGLNTTDPNANFTY